MSELVWRSAQSAKPRREGSLRWHAELVCELARAQLLARDQSTIIGFGWSFLNPLIMLVLLYVFFNRRIGQDIPYYPVFLLIGLLHFSHFTNGTSSGASVLVTMRHLTRDAIFPKSAVVFAAVLAGAFELAVSACICLAIARVAGIELTPSVLLLVPVFMLQIGTVLWLSLLLSCTYVFVQDIGHVLQVFLRMLFFVTPTFYSPDFIGDGPAHAFLMANPLAHLIHFSRVLIIGGEPFPTLAFGVLTISTVVAIVVSLAVFEWAEPSFAEHL